MLTAYMDESGTHQGSKILIVAAYVGLSDDWEPVEERFKRADKYSGIIFHAVDCAQGGKEFRGMSKDKRYRLMKKMIKIVNDHDIMGMGFGVYVDDYERLTREMANIGRLGWNIRFS